MADQPRAVADQNWQCSDSCPDNCQFLFLPLPTSPPPSSHPPTSPYPFISSSPSLISPTSYPTFPSPSSIPPHLPLPQLPLPPLPLPHLPLPHPHLPLPLYLIFPPSSPYPTRCVTVTPCCGFGPPTRQLSTVCSHDSGLLWANLPTPSWPLRVSRHGDHPI